MTGGKVDIRWKQRVSNFSSAHTQLKAAVELAKQCALSDLEKQGMIQAFEFTHELAWSVMKDYFDYQGGNLINLSLFHLIDNPDLIDHIRRVGKEI